MLLQVCIPGLHISLGIFDRLWDLLENACTELDLTLAKDREGMEGNTYECYCQALREAERLKEKLKVEQQHSRVLSELITYLALHLPNPATDPSLRKAIKEASDLKKTITTTVNIISKIKLLKWPYFTGATVGSNRRPTEGKI